MTDAAETKGPAIQSDTIRADTVRAKRRGRNLALLAVLVAFVLIVYIVTIVKFDLATG